MLMGRDGDSSAQVKGRFAVTECSRSFRSGKTEIMYFVYDGSPGSWSAHSRTATSDASRTVGGSAERSCTVTRSGAMSSRTLQQGMANCRDAAV